MLKGSVPVRYHVEPSRTYLVLQNEEYTELLQHRNFRNGLDVKYLSQGSRVMSQANPHTFVAADSHE